MNFRRIPSPPSALALRGHTDLTALAFPRVHDWHRLAIEQILGPCDDFPIVMQPAPPELTVGGSSPIYQLTGTNLNVAAPSLAGTTIMTLNKSGGRVGGILTNAGNLLFTHCGKHPEGPGGGRKKGGLMHPSFPWKNPP